MYQIYFRGAWGILLGSWLLFGAERVGAISGEITVTRWDEKLQALMERVPVETVLNDEVTSRNYFMLTDKEGHDLAETALGAGFYRAAYIASLVKAKPFIGMRLILQKSPPPALAESSAALAVGLMGLAEDRTIPGDCAIIGELYPDGTLKPVTHIRERVEALLTNGFKTIVIPALQVAVSQENGPLVVLEDLAKKRQATCVPASTLEEAARAIWPDMTFPLLALTGNPKGYWLATPDFLRTRVAKLVEACQEESKQTKPLPQDTLLPRIRLKEMALQNFEAGLSTARAGRFYEAYEQLRLALGQFRIARLNPPLVADKALPDLDSESKRLLQKFDDFDKKKVPSRSVPEAYAFLQTNHAISIMRGQLSGSQNLVKKLSAVRKGEEKNLPRALASYAAAVEEAKTQADSIQDYELLGQSDSSMAIDKEDENAKFISQVASRAFLDGGERFFFRMQKFPEDQRAYLLYETGFYSQLATLLEARNKDEAIFSLNQEIRMRRTDNLQKTTFVPGAAYVPPEQAAAPPKDTGVEENPLPMLMAYVNQIADQALMEFQLTDSEANFEKETQTWQFHHGTDLLIVLDQASQRAETSLKLFRSLEIPSRVPDLIYQRARLLASMSSERAKLDALREYWRCSQACLASQVLFYSVPAQVAKPEAEPAETAPEEPASPVPVPTPPLPPPRPPEPEPPTTSPNVGMPAAIP